MTDPRPPESAENRTLMVVGIVIHHFRLHGLTCDPYQQGSGVVPSESAPNRRTSLRSDTHPLQCRTRRVAIQGHAIPGYFYHSMREIVLTVGFFRPKRVGQPNFPDEKPTLSSSEGRILLRPPPRQILVRRHIPPNLRLLLKSKPGNG